MDAARARELQGVWGTLGTRDIRHRKKSVVARCVADGERAGKQNTFVRWVGNVREGPSGAGRGDIIVIVIERSLQTVRALGGVDSDTLRQIHLELGILIHRRAEDWKGCIAIAEY